MPFDLKELLRERHGENFQLHAKYLNPQLTKVIKTLGFDRLYVRGEGCYLFDDENKRYLDLLSGFGVFALGRSHPVIKDALRQAIDADLPNMVQMDCALLPGLLAEQLVQRSHAGIERVIFGNSGAEAVEAAIKFARASTGRSRICYFDHAYHGLTMGALSINGSEEFKSGFGPLVPGATRITFGDVDALRTELRAGDVAAFIVEPIQGKGVYVLDRETWREIEAAVHEAGALLICDEVQSGIGRTGRFYAFEHYGLTPDIITVSKALSGGFVPVGAMLTSDKIVRSVYSSMDRAMVHSTTFKGNQLAMVAGLATLSVFDDDHIVEHAAAMGDLWKAKLGDLAARHEFISDIRGEGQMIGIEFGRPVSAGARRRWRVVEATRTAMFSQTLVVPLFHRYGILTQVAADNINVIKLLPPLIAGETEIDLFAGALDELLSDAERSSGWLVEFGLTMAKGAFKRTRSPEGVSSDAS
ncbi:MAG TPA: aspartate aminotransferase family protein [Acidimicrobiales bacterium]|nr:aspartate aminotransferase family protein [Acidimicrobiales bacterium]